MKLAINYRKGVNDVFFGMPPDVVSHLLGKPESTSTATGIDEGSPVSRSEIRSGMKFSYENEKLVCISGELGVPLYIGDSRIPPTFLEALKMLRSASKLNWRFPKDTSYLFADLGIVVYPSTVTDLDVGIITTTIKHRIAVCDREIVKRYTQHFLNKEEQSEGLNTFLLGVLGNFAENHSEPESVS